MKWSIITGEYPPQPGGVSDYTELLAQQLAQAGDEVEVSAPRTSPPRGCQPPVRLNELPGHFGPAAIYALHKHLKLRGPGRILVQYVPHAFGFKAMNLLFCMWLYGMRQAEITVIFHEVAYPFQLDQPLKWNILAVTNRTMAFLVARSAKRIFTTTPAWNGLVERLAGKRASIAWLPISSSIPAASQAARDPKVGSAIHDRYAPEGGFLIGHFGTYGTLITSLLGDCIADLLARRADCNVLLLGRNGDSFRDRFLATNPKLQGRIHALGCQEAPSLARHIAACDLMLQPYPDGITTRRSSTMNLLASGMPVVTNFGHLSESFWRENGALCLSADNRRASLVDAVERLLSDESERHRLSAASRQLYIDRFDIGYAVCALRSPLRSPA